MYPGSVYVSLEVRYNVSSPFKVITGAVLSSRIIFTLRILSFNDESLTLKITRSFSS